MSSVNTYSTEGFRDKFMKGEEIPHDMLKADFGKFFIVKVEEMLRLIKLPVPPSRSTTHTFIYISSGEAIISIGSEKYMVRQDECIFVPAGQIFSFDNPDVNTGYLCNFHEDFIIGKYGQPDLLRGLEFLSIYGNPYVKLENASQHVALILSRMLSLYQKNGINNPELLHPYFLALLAEINQVYQPQYVDFASRYTTLTVEFKALLSQYIHTLHQVKDYASLLNVSPNHLNKVIKATTGTSPSEWIDNQLIMEAKVLLYQTDFPINQVAAEVGMMDQSYFSRFFRKHVGHTPVEFRRMIETS